MPFIKFPLILTVMVTLFSWGQAILAATADGSFSTSAIPEFTAAGAASLVSATLFWIVRLMASGVLVHRDVAQANTKLKELLEASNRVADKAMEREATLTKLLIEQRAKGTRG